MIDISTLPKDPTDALEVVLDQILAKKMAKDAKIAVLRSQNVTLYLELRNLLLAARKIATMVDDSELIDISTTALKFNDNMIWRQIEDGASQMKIAILASRIDNHFLPEKDIDDFEIAKLEKGDRDEIFEIMHGVRRLVEQATSIESLSKRRIYLRISQIENELLKERVGFSAFATAAYEGANLIERYGEAVKPIAEAFQIARTKVERKISGNIAIEESEKPKQIEGPKRSK